MTLWTVKAPILGSHNDISAKLAWPLLLILVSVQQTKNLPILRLNHRTAVTNHINTDRKSSCGLRSTEAPGFEESWKRLPPKPAQQGALGDDSAESEMFWIHPLSQSLPQTSLTADEVSVLDHIQAPHEVTEQSLLSWLGAALPDLRSTWCSFTAGWRLPAWAGLSHRENPHTLCTWLTKFLWMLLNQIWILWSSLLYVHKVTPAVGIVRCGTDHLPWTLSDHPHWAEQQEPTRWCKIHQFDSWDYFLKYKSKFQEMRELMWASSQERLFHFE